MDDSTHLVAIISGLYFLIYGIDGIVRNQMSFRLGRGYIISGEGWTIRPPYARPYGICVLVSAAVLLGPRLWSLLTGLPLDVVPSVLSEIFGLVFAAVSLLVVLFIQILMFILNAVKPKPVSSEDTSSTP